MAKGRECGLTFLAGSFGEGLTNPSLTRYQREIAERNLDWFEFWMRDRVDPAAAKREQYVRWSRASARALFHDNISRAAGSP